MSSQRKRLARKVAEGLIANANKDPALADAAVGLAAYKTQDGRYIVDFGETFFEYTEGGRSDAIGLRYQVLERARNEAATANIIDDYDIGHDFPDRVDEWCKQLATLCRVKLDFSTKERSFLESYVKRRRKKFLQPGWFEPLLAYCLKSAHVSRGGTIEGTNRETGEPYPHLVVNNYEYNILKSVFEGLEEEGFEITY